MDGLSLNVAVASGCVKYTCIPNGSLIGQKLPRLFHFFIFGRLGQLGQSASTDFPESIIFKARPTLVYFHAKNQGDSSRRSRDIPFFNLYRKAERSRITQDFSLFEDFWPLALFLPIWSSNPREPSINDIDPVMALINHHLGKKIRTTFGYLVLVPGLF